MEKEPSPRNISKYRAELMKTAAGSPYATEMIGTPIDLPEDANAEVNLPEATPELDALQEFAPTPDTLESFLERNQSIGFLRIQAFTGPQAVPVANADVLVARGFIDGARRFAGGSTDESGILDGIVLPAPNGSLAQQPGTLMPYALYDIYVSHPNYRTEIYRQVPVFDGVVSIQPVRFQASLTGE